MARYPREEIDYKKLYKKLDLDKDLGIKWPEKPNNFDDSEIVFIKDHEEVEESCNSYFVDEIDEIFCKENNISEDMYQKFIETLDKNYLNELFSGLDSIQEITDFEYCDVCGKNTNNDSKRMIICQGCGISVHEDCYGVVESPGKRWLCKKCIFYFEDGECAFCNRKDGILKKTDNNKWAHVICALLHPDLSFCNTNIRDPIETVDLVPIEGNCKICNEKSSYLINCAYEGCTQFYHPSCCSELYYSDLNNSVTYCNDHNPLHKNRKLLSKRSRMRDYNAYPELMNNIFLRENRKLLSPAPTEYMKIVKQEPQIIKTGLDKFDQDPNYEKICEFWKEKRKAFGFYFQNIFILSNRFLK